MGWCLERKTTMTIIDSKLRIMTNFFLISVSFQIFWGGVISLINLHHSRVLVVTQSLIAGMSTLGTNQGMQTSWHAVQ